MVCINCCVLVRVSHHSGEFLNWNKKSISNGGCANEAARAAQKGAETNTSLLRRAPALTGFHWNNKEEIERQRGGGEVDLQIKLSSLPAERPRSHVSLCEGETRRSANQVGFSFLALKRKKKSDKEEEKEAIPHTSHCARINPNQHSCQTDSYKRFSNAVLKRSISKLRSVFSIVPFCVYKLQQNLCSSGLTMKAQKQKKRCIEMWSLTLWRTTQFGSESNFFGKHGKSCERKTWSL